MLFFFFGKIHCPSASSLNIWNNSPRRCLSFCVLFFFSLMIRRPKRNNKSQKHWQKKFKKKKRFFGSGGCVVVARVWIRRTRRTRCSNQKTLKKKKKKKKKKRSLDRIHSSISVRRCSFVKSSGLTYQENFRLLIYNLLVLFVRINRPGLPIMFILGHWTCVMTKDSWIRFCLVVVMTRPFIIPSDWDIDGWLIWPWWSQLCTSTLNGYYSWFERQINRHLSLFVSGSESMNDPFHHCSVFPALDAKCTVGINGFIVLPSFSTSTTTRLAYI